MDTYDKVTLYWPSDFGFGWRGHYCRSAKVAPQPWRQDSACLRVELIQPRQRKWRETEVASGELVVVQDFAEREPVPMYGAALPTSTPNCIVRQARHLAFAPEWTQEFDAWLASSGVRVLRDYRQPAPAVAQEQPPAPVPRARERTRKQLDAEVERIYARLARGRVIEVANIPHVFDAAYAAEARGQSLEEAVAAAIDRYCVSEQQLRAASR